jgi:hypothetical protein
MCCLGSRSAIDYFGQKMKFTSLGSFPADVEPAPKICWCAELQVLCSEVPKSYDCVKQAGQFLKIQIL